jgi:hypothetical protein
VSDDAGGDDEELPVEGCELSVGAEADGVGAVAAGVEDDAWVGAACVTGCDTAAAGVVCGGAAGCCGGWVGVGAVVTGVGLGLGFGFGCDFGGVVVAGAAATAGCEGAGGW